MRKRLIALLAVLFAFGMFTACGSDDSSSSSSSEASSSSSETSSSAATDDDHGDDDHGDDDHGDDHHDDDGHDHSGPETKAAFIMVAPIGDAGWNYAHDVARQYAEETTGVETAYVDAVPEGTAEFGNYVRDFIDQGYNVIIGTSFGYMDDMLSLADEYPDVVFEHVSGYKMNETNFGNTFGRMYEPRYLSGMVAGSATTSNLIGYVAAFPIPEVIRGINAFTLGVQAINPDAEVAVSYTHLTLPTKA